MRKLCYLYKIISFKQPSYFLWSVTSHPKFSSKKVSFSQILRTLFYHNTVNEWNKLDPEIRRINSYVEFRRKLLSFVRTTENKTFGINYSLGIKLLSRLRIDFSHLNEHNTLNPLCSCSRETENITHF